MRLVAWYFNVKVRVLGELSGDVRDIYTKADDEVIAVVALRRRLDCCGTMEKTGLLSQINELRLHKSHMFRGQNR